MPVSLRVDAADYGSLSRALKQSAPAIRKQMRKEIGAAVRPVVKKARANILGASGIPTPFKSAAARRVRLVNRDAPKRTEIGIIAPAAGADFPDAHRSLNRVGSFRHPVFGNRKVWAVQPGPQGWFDDPFTEARYEIWRAVERAMENAARELESRAH